MRDRHHRTGKRGVFGLRGPAGGGGAPPRRRRQRPAPGGGARGGGGGATRALADDFTPSPPPPLPRSGGEGSQTHSGGTMPPYRQLGSLPRKRHIAHPHQPGFRGEGLYYEEVITTAG